VFVDVFKVWYYEFSLVGGENTNPTGECSKIVVSVQWGGRNESWAVDYHLFYWRFDENKCKGFFYKQKILYSFFNMCLKYWGVYYFFKLLG